MTHISNETLNLLIAVIRGKKVMLSMDLAELYGVQVRALIQAIKRNKSRFPEDFMFQLTEDEVESLRSQNVILNTGKRGHHLKYSPYAFTQEGIAMLSSVLRSPRPVEANIAIMRAFVKLRELMDSHKDLAQKIDQQGGYQVKVV